jgi:putative ABC transport system permease protein
MIHGDFIIRQIRRSSRQAVVFVLCIALSLATLTAFNGFSKSANQWLQNDARKLHAADIIIRSHEKPSAALAAAIAAQVAQGRVRATRYYEFYSVVRAADEQASLLASLKVVAPGYPFYGAVSLQSGRRFSDVLTAGRVVVAKNLLDRLHLAVGDNLKVGYTTLTIADVVLSEPDRPVDLFSFGPRVFVSERDLEALGLLQKGSRIHHVTLLKTQPGADIEEIGKTLKRVSMPGQESVDTFRTARSRIKRFLDNFLFFLNLVGIFILLIAGFGIQGTLTAFLNEKQRTIAVMKTVGATNRYITFHFMVVVFLLGLAGTIAGIAVGYTLQYGLRWILTGFLPPELRLVVSWAGILEGALLGFVIVALFSFLPLYRLKDMRPVMIFRKDLPAASRRWPYYASGAVIFLFFLALVFWHMKDLRTGLYFVGAIGGLIALAWLCTHLLLRFLKGLRIPQLSIRQAVKGLFRKGNATKPIVITLTASLCVIFSIYLIEKNLDTTFIQSYPPDAPNLFFLDIQPAQLDAFQKEVGRAVRFYPIVRARVTAINGDRIDHRKEGGKRRDNLGRVFNLTYRSDLLEDEKIIRGQSLFRPDWKEVQVSVMDTVIDMQKMSVGDRITFKIQGVPLEARISSIRTRINESMSPFFYFVFQEEALRQAPHTIFSAVRIDPGQIAALQNRIVSQFPNISAIDLSETIRTFAQLMKKLSQIIRLFSLLSITAGILILISAVFATRAERIVESVYYKILGAKKPFIVQVFALENLIIGLLSGILAFVIAQVYVWWLCRFVFDIPYHAFLLNCLVMVIAAAILVIAVGMVSSRSILAKKPITYLRELPEE